MCLLSETAITENTSPAKLVPVPKKADRALPDAAGAAPARTVTSWPTLPVGLEYMCWIWGPVEQFGNLKFAMRVFQLKKPVAFRYSVVYQKVQSSTGSTCIAL